MAGWGMDQLGGMSVGTLAGDVIDSTDGFAWCGAWRDGHD